LKKRRKSKNNCYPIAPDYQGYSPTMDQQKPFDYLRTNEESSLNPREHEDFGTPSSCWRVQTRLVKLSKPKVQKLMKQSLIGRRIS
jgi:hypothetical protein